MNIILGSSMIVSMWGFIKIFKKDKSVLAKITNKKLYSFVKLAFSENKLESFVNKTLQEQYPDLTEEKKM